MLISYLTFLTDLIVMLNLELDDDKVTLVITRYRLIFLKEIFFKENARRMA